MSESGNACVHACEIHESAVRTAARAYARSVIALNKSIKKFPGHEKVKARQERCERAYRALIKAWDEQEAAPWQE